MTKSNGIYMMPCKVNGIKLNFIIDTGASDVSISLTEAMFMLKNGYLSPDDFTGSEYYRMANGSVEEGTKIKLKSIEIGNIKIQDVSARVVHTLDAPLLLGQSVLTKLGRIEFDYHNNRMIIHDYNSNNKSPKNNNQIIPKTIPSSANQKAIDTDYIQTKPPTVNKNPKTSTSFQSDKCTGKYAQLNDLPFDVSLSSEPKSNSKIVYNCPKTATLCIVNDDDYFYYKVLVNGYLGFILKSYVRLN